MTTPIDPRDARAIEMVTRYRERLLEVLRVIEMDPFQSQRDAHRQVALIVDDLTGSIMAFYGLGSSESLSHLERTVVLPSLKRLRDILRNSKGSRRQLRDTLLKATQFKHPMETRVTW